MVKGVPEKQLKSGEKKKQYCNTANGNLQKFIILISHTHSLYLQLISYIDELSLLAPSISGFCKGHSTVTALLGIRDDLLRAMKRVACV